MVLAALHRPRRLPRPRFPAGAVERSALALLAAAGAFALIGALAPEVEYDALWYHLALPRRYLDAGSLRGPATASTCLTIRCALELLFGYGLAIADQVAAKLVNFGVGVLLALATYRLGLQVASRRAALLAAAILAMTPTVLWEATTTYVELATAFFVILSLSWVMRFAQDPSTRALALGGRLVRRLGARGQDARADRRRAAHVAALDRRVAAGSLGATCAAAAASLLAVALLPALPWYLRA